MYGPLLISCSGNPYIFTAVYMFAKYIYAIYSANNDAVTVGTVLFLLETIYGVCDTIVSDQISKFVAKTMKKI